MDAFHTTGQSSQTAGGGANDTYMTLTKSLQSADKLDNESVLNTKTSKILVEKGDSKLSGFFDLLNDVKSPDDDDAVLMGDTVTGENGEKKKKKDLRYTPLEQRKPKIIFFQDPEVIESYRQIK